jgi:dipeptidyl aminopeptidase/acylaminoacyl peptidase
MTSIIPDLETLLKIGCVDPDYGFSLTPDGVKVSYSSNSTGNWEIYSLPLDGSTPPEQVTSGPGAKFAPRWSPDGRFLAYVLDDAGGEQFDIYVHDHGTGRHTNLTPATAESILPNYCWSPDSAHIAFISDRSGRFDTYVMSAAGGPARPAFDIPHPDWEVHWSPDGRWLAIVVEAHGQDYATYVVPVSGEDAASITDQGDAICAKDARWAPDSSCIAFSSDVEGFFNVGLFDLPTQSTRWLTGGEGDKEQPAWSHDGRQLAYVLNRGPSSSLVVLDLISGQKTEYQVASGVHYRPGFTPDDSALVFMFDNPSHPDDLWLLSLRPALAPSGSDRLACGQSKERPRKAPCQRLTCRLPPELRSAPFVMPSEVRYPSLDGSSVPALLYMPQGQPETPPAVVYVHGGPNWLTQVTWDPLLQHMVSRGWIVFAPNYRGSTGYGRAWQMANRFDLGGGDTKDVAAGADFLVREGLADPGRIAVTGRSYGGYLTMTSLTKYPDRWAAGSAVVPFLNWFTGHANSREDLQHWDLENFGHPEVDRDLYHERSPYFFLDRVSAPVQLICGAHDPRCPASESTQAHEALLALGKESELVLYPDEGHSFLKTENLVDAKIRRAAFLAEHLERGRTAH